MRLFTSALMPVGTAAAASLPGVDMQRSLVYPPLDTLKPVAPDVWIVDSGPHHAMGLAVPVRMTVIQLKTGEIWLHSPTRHDDRLRSEIERLGPIRHLVAPNVAHWVFVKDWQAHCGDALAWAAPGLRQRSQVKRSGAVFHHDLGSSAPSAWADDIDQIIVPGGFGVNEVAFLHRATRTLMLTDLIENFEAEKLPVLMRPLVRLAGAMAPDGKAPAHLRFAINRKRRAAAEAAQRLVDWAPERVIFAHGRWFDTNGAAQLRHSFRWLLD
jgi:Domain of unknown function (DUF4336)